MNKELNEQTEFSADTLNAADTRNTESIAQSETVSGSQSAEKTPAQGGADGKTENSVSLGKFKDVSALLSAYNSLEAEFTKRCQRIKELETEKRNDDKAVSAPKSSEVTSENGNNLEKEDKDAILKGYLKEVLEHSSKAIIMDGQGRSVKTPVFKPRTVEEAGKLAKNLLEKNQS